MYVAMHVYKSVCGSIAVDWLFMQMRAQGKHVALRQTAASCLVVHDCCLQCNAMLLFADHWPQQQ